MSKRPRNNLDEEDNTQPTKKRKLSGDNEERVSVDLLENSGNQNSEINDPDEFLNTPKRRESSDSDALTILSPVSNPSILDGKPSGRSDSTLSTVGDENEGENERYEYDDEDSDDLGDSDDENMDLSDIKEIQQEISSRLNEISKRGKGEEIKESVFINMRSKYKKYKRLYGSEKIEEKLEEDKKQRDFKIKAYEMGEECSILRNKNLVLGMKYDETKKKLENELNISIFEKSEFQRKLKIQETEIKKLESQISTLEESNTNFSKFFELFYNLTETIRRHKVIVLGKGIDDSEKQKFKDMDDDSASNILKCEIKCSASESQSCSPENTQLFNDGDFRFRFLLYLRKADLEKYRFHPMSIRTEQVGEYLPIFSDVKYKDIKESISNEFSKPIFFEIKLLDAFLKKLNRFVNYELPNIRIRKRK